MSFLTAPFFLLFACDMGPSADTVVDELRVLATLAEPPEALPGEAVALETLIVSPDGASYDVLMWTCTFTGEACLEASGSTAWDGMVLVEGATEQWQSSTVTVSSALGYVASAEPIPLVQHWALACEPGLCPVIDAAAADPAQGSDGATRLQELLSSPTDFLADLPMGGASLGLRTLSVSTRGVDERLQNPTVDCAVRQGFSSSTEVEGVVPYQCTVDGELSDVASAWGYATDGGWGGANVPLFAGDTEFDYDWFAPEESAEVDAWVIVTDGVGGVGIFETGMEVR